MRKNLAIVFLSLTFLIPGLSNARDYGRISYPDRVYLVLKYGEVTIADDVPEDGSDIRNVGIVLGRGFNDTVSMEFEYTLTVSKDDSYFSSGNEASVDTLGIFLTAKTQGDLYVKGRAGWARTTQEFGDDPVVDIGGTENVYGMAVGVAAGYKFMKGGAIELEYMIYPTRDDVDFDTRPVLGPSGPVFEEDLEMDFISLNYVMSFE